MFEESAGESKAVRVTGCPQEWLSPASGRFPPIPAALLLPGQDHKENRAEAGVRGAQLQVQADAGD